MPTLSTVQAIGGARLCGGGRTQGGIYLEAATLAAANLVFPDIDQFLIDPTQVVDPTQMGLNRMGMSLIKDKAGVHHLLDWVGESHYPLITDFVEEARRMGISRKISPQIDFSLLEPGSKLIFVHAKAHIQNSAAFTPHIPNFRCRKGHPHSPNDHCISLHWHSDEAKRDLSSGSYGLKPLEPAAPRKIYLPGRFLAVPITGIAVIESKDATPEQAALEKAQRSRIRVYRSQT